MGYTILIVDDSSITRAVIKRTLKMSGLPVDALLEASDGAAALALLAGRRADLVLADLNMPTMDGAEMARRILSDPATADTAVAVISADPNAARIEQLKAQGVRGYLRKPFTPEAVRSLVESILGVTHV